MNISGISCVVPRKEVVSTGVFESKGPDVFERVGGEAVGKFSWATTTCVFDWDDTLFPSGCYIDAQKRKDPFYSHHLAELDVLAHGVLAAAVGYGKVFVITNAPMVWYVDTLALYPKTQALVRMLEAQGVFQCVSAADRYKPHMKSPTEWKIQTFKDVLDERAGSIPRGVKHNIVSVGDGPSERMAMDRYVASHADTVCGKHRVFKAYGTFTRMKAALESLAKELGEWYAFPRSHVEKHPG